MTNIRINLFLYFKLCSYPSHWFAVYASQRWYGEALGTCTSTRHLIWKRLILYRPPLLLTICPGILEHILDDKNQHRYWLSQRKLFWDTLNISAITITRTKKSKVIFDNHKSISSHAGNVSTNAFTKCSIAKSTSTGLGTCHFLALIFCLENLHLRPKTCCLH